MTRSELNALMVGGFSTISGGLLAIYAGMGIDPGHLLTASVISAPASLIVAKILLPETEESTTQGRLESPATTSMRLRQRPKRNGGHEQYQHHRDADRLPGVNCNAGRIGQRLCWIHR